jgi:hypothetical protein
MSRMHEVKNRNQDRPEGDGGSDGISVGFHKASKTGMKSSLRQEKEITQSLFSDFAISRCRSSFRFIFPERVFGSSSTNSMARGYL